MDEKELEKIEEILFISVEQRFGKMFKMMLYRKQKIKDLFMILVKAFVRCLYYAEDEMFLKDIAAIIRAEAIYVMDEPLIAIGGTSQMVLSEQFANVIDNEIHRWIMILAENNKLPPGSEYHRFTGKFVKK
jgi:hypothetical protein